MTRIAIFAKAPQPGNVKTRLIPALGAQGAAALAHRLLAHTLHQALEAKVGDVELCMSPSSADPAWQGVALPVAVLQTTQGDGDLGDRMARAVTRITRHTMAANTPSSRQVLLIGTDCPALTAPLFKLAAQKLEQHDAVLLPAHDGGYVLLGLKAPCPELFEHMAWSTSVVAFETLRRMAALNMRIWQGPTLHDIDEPGDLQHLSGLFTELFQFNPT